MQLVLTRLYQVDFAGLQLIALARDAHEIALASGPGAKWFQCGV